MVMGQFQNNTSIYIPIPVVDRFVVVTVIRGVMVSLVELVHVESMNNAPDPPNDELSKDILRKC
jgi:hypothetical protein